jgi:hypothetical protein
VVIKSLQTHTQGLDIFGTYEPDTTQGVTDHCKPGWVVCNIGAHHGFFSLLMSKIIGTGGYCFAFEPFSENYI